MKEEKKYFVVVFPEDSSTPHRQSQTFDSQLEAVKEAKKTPGARFRICTSVDEIDHVSSVDTPNREKRFPSESSPAPEVAIAAFPSVTVSMLSEFRMIIEQNDVRKFKDKVWSNPRYLIANGDCPTILREGNWRRNGLHVAAYARRPEMISLLLETIKDSAFLKLAYPMESEEDLAFKANHLADLYLKNREKKKCNTPLHCAVAAGCVRCVEMLVAVPECRRFEKNADDKLPFDLIPDNLAEWEKERLFQLLGSGVVLCFESQQGPQIVLQDETNVSDACETFDGGHLRAIAGPVPCDLLPNFMHTWKAGNESIPKSLKALHSAPGLNVKLSDYEKGAERIGRKLCRQYRVLWSERWDFLDDFLDIASSRGLKKLDEFLSRICEDMKDKKLEEFILKTPPKPPVKRSKIVFGSLPSSPYERPANPVPPDSSPVTPITSLCGRMAELRLDYCENSDEEIVDDNTVSGSFSISFSQDLEICDEEDDALPEECDSFSTAPGSPSDEDWRRERPSYFIGYEEFTQEDAQVFLALDDCDYLNDIHSEEYPYVFDWFLRILTKFTMSEIERRARNRGVVRTSLSIASSGSVRALSSPASSSGILGSPFSPRIAVEKAFSTTPVRSKRKSLILR